MQLDPCTVIALHICACDWLQDRQRGDPVAFDSVVMSAVPTAFHGIDLAKASIAMEIGANSWKRKISEALSYLILAQNKPYLYSILQDFFRTSPPSFCVIAYMDMALLKESVLRKKCHTSSGWMRCRLLSQVTPPFLYFFLSDDIVHSTAHHPEPCPCRNPHISHTRVVSRNTTQLEWATCAGF